MNRKITVSEFKYQVDMRTHIHYAKQESAMEIARNLKAMGILVEQIAQGTGLTGEQIRGL